MRIMVNNEIFDNVMKRSGETIINIVLFASNIKEHSIVFVPIGYCICGERCVWNHTMSFYSIGLPSCVVLWLCKQLTSHATSTFTQPLLVEHNYIEYFYISM